MWPSVALTPDQVEIIAKNVLGGLQNIDDVYPLSPMQEGVLFHHLLTPKSDPYLIQNNISFSSRQDLDKFVAALNKVISRHDALRAGVVWEGVADPVQVIWKHAPVEVEEVSLDLSCGSIADQLKRRIGSPALQLDLSRAPSMRLVASQDPETRRWVLVWLSHHLFSDYATDSLVKAEIDALLQDADAPLVPVAPFREFVMAARRESDGAASSAFFSEMLGDVEAVTAPFGITNIHRDASDVRDARAYVEPELVKRLKEASKRLGVGAARLFHVAWALVVSRCSGHNNAIFGTILSGRAPSDRALILGPLINTLPIHIRLGPVGAADCVREVDRLLKGLVQHRHTSLSVAQQCSAIPAPAPLFTAVFNYYRDAATLADPGRREDHANDVLAFSQDYPLTNYPVMLTVEDFGSAVGLTVQTDPAIDPQRVCRMMARAIEGLVDALAMRPDQPIGAIDILPEEERQLVLEGWNRTERDYPADVWVHQLFEEQVEKSPDRIAVRAGSRTLTYRELNARANQLAHHLRDLGVRPDSRVAVCMRRTLDVPVALLGILKAGGAYVPIDPAYPKERQVLILEDSAPSMVVVDEATLQSIEDAIEATEANPRLLDLDRADWTHRPTTNPDLPDGFNAACLSYLIYTSGSTGRPKGVMVEHRNLANLIYWAAEAFEPGELAGVVASTSLCFDLHAFECFVPLSTGGTMIIVENGLSLDEVQGASLLNTVPSVLRELAVNGNVPRSLRAINVAGEKLSGAIVEAVFENSDVPRVRNLYGPSETTVYSTCASMEKLSGFRPDIGHPVANTKIYILDGMMNPVPIGVPGEIYIGGRGVVRGYLQRPDLTAERFIDSPFIQEDRLYRTGDMAWYLPDGAINFIGRNDFQVKVRGFRIELGEIEEQVRADPGVAQAVVIAHEARPGELRLICFVVAPELSQNEVEDRLRRRLSAALPAHLVPSAIVRLERFPVTPNGKLDRAALPVPEAGQERDLEGEAPIGSVEEAISTIWSEILSVDAIGRHDNFFELGGHSLHAMRAIAAMRRSLTPDCSIRDMFLYPTVAGFAAMIERLPVYEDERI